MAGNQEQLEREEGQLTSEEQTPRSLNILSSMNSLNVQSAQSVVSDQRPLPSFISACRRRDQTLTLELEVEWQALI